MSIQGVIESIRKEMEMYVKDFEMGSIEDITAKVVTNIVDTECYVEGLTESEIDQVWKAINNDH